MLHDLLKPRSTGVVKIDSDCLYLMSEACRLGTIQMKEAERNWDKCLTV